MPMVHSLYSSGGNAKRTVTLGGWTWGASADGTQMDFCCKSTT